MSSYNLTSDEHINFISVTGLGRSDITPKFKCNKQRKGENKTVSKRTVNKKKKTCRDDPPAKKRKITCKKNPEKNSAGKGKIGSKENAADSMKNAKCLRNSQSRSRCLNKNTQKKADTAADNRACRVCNIVYKDANDPKKEEGWIQCSHCRIWLHETCAETYGVFDDEEYLCMNCV